LSGHHAARTVPEPELWPGALPTDATLAIYMPGQNLAQVAASLLRSGVPAAMPCVAVTDASRPEAAYAASQLSSLSHLPTSFAPTLLLVGHAFEAVLSRGIEPESLEHVSTFASPIAVDSD
jgi:uroporphyrin-III C-methyltransferase